MRCFRLPKVLSGVIVEISKANYAQTPAQYDDWMEQ